MTLEKLVGTDCDCREEPDRFYRTAVERLGGPAALREAIPFSLETLKESYAEDKNFIADMTPLGMWDAATGNGGKFGRIVYTKITGAPFRGILRNHGISYVTPSQAVCILKTAAQMLVERQNASLAASPRMETPASWLMKMTSQATPGARSMATTLT